MSLLTQASLILTPTAYKASTLYSIIPSSGNGDMTASRATTATRTNNNRIVETVASNVPRLDYISGVGSILLEPQRTNSIPNSTMVGASMSPSTIPTGWQSNTNGLTQTIVGIGVENGLNYIDVRFNGIASSTSNTGIRMTSATTISALQNQNWTFSTYVKILAQPLPPTSYAIVIYERNSIGGYLQGTTTTFNNATLNKISLSSTLANASTAYVQPDIIGNIINGQSYDFTLRIAGTQLEQGAYATSYIPTVASTVTRNADVITRSNIYTNGLITNAGGTFFIDQSSLEFTGGGGLEYSIFLTTLATDSIVFQIRSDGFISFRKWTSNVATINQTIANSNVSRTKLAVKWDISAGTIKVFFNGSLAYSYTSQTFVNYQTLSLTDANANTTQGAHKIYSTMLFPTPLTDAECASITTL